MGSIAAILSGFLLNYLNQRRVQKERRAEQLSARQNHLESVKSAAQVILTRTTNLANIIRERDENDPIKYGGAVGAALEHFKGAVGVINAVEVHAVGMSRVAHHLFNLRIVVASALGYAETQSKMYLGIDPKDFVAHKGVKEVLVGGAQTVSDVAKQVIEGVDEELRQLCER